MAHFPKPFYKEKRHTWYVEIDRKQVNLGQDKDKAFELYHKLMAERRAGVTVIREQGEACAVILDRYLSWVKKHRAKRTYESYKERIQSFLDFLKRSGQGLLRVADLTPMHVQDWVDSHPNWSNGMTRGRMVVVQGAFNWAAKMGLLKQIGGASPIAQLEKPPPGKRERVITPEEYAHIREAIVSERFRELIDLAWHTGARPQELLLLQARHFDAENQCWVFPPEEAKGRRWRVVYLAPDALEISHRLVLAAGEGRLLLNSAGDPWNRHSVACAFQRLEKVLGVQYCLYNFRHSWATRALQNGVDPVTVSVLLGHADGSMLGRVYQHLGHNRDYLREAAGRATSQSAQSQQRKN